MFFATFEFKCDSCGRYALLESPEVIIPGSRMVAPNPPRGWTLGEDLRLACFNCVERPEVVR